MKYLYISLLLFLSNIIFLFAENIPLEGNVYDTQKNPIVGASIYLPHSQTGTTTDEKGYFSLSVTPGDTILTVSYVGFDSQNIPIHRHHDHIHALKIEMKGSMELEEVVVSKRQIGRAHV